MAIQSNFQSTVRNTNRDYHRLTLDLHCLGGENVSIDLAAGGGRLDWAGLQIFRNPVIGGFSLYSAGVSRNCDSALDMADFIFSLFS